MNGTLPFLVIHLILDPKKITIAGFSKSCDAVTSVLASIM